MILCSKTYLKMHQIAQNLDIVTVDFFFFREYLTVVVNIFTFHDSDGFYEALRIQAKCYLSPTLYYVSVYRLSP